MLIILLVMVQYFEVGVTYLKEKTTFLFFV